MRARVHTRKHTVDDLIPIAVQAFAAPRRPPLPRDGHAGGHALSGQRRLRTCVRE